MRFVRFQAAKKRRYFTVFKVECLFFRLHGLRQPENGCARDAINSWKTMGCCCSIFSGCLSGGRDGNKRQPENDFRQPFFRLPKWVIFCHFKNRQAMCELLKAWVWRQDAMKTLKPKQRPRQPENGLRTRFLHAHACFARDFQAFFLG